MKKTNFKYANILIYLMAISLMFTTVLFVPCMASAEEEIEEGDDTVDLEDDSDSELDIINNFTAMKIEKTKVTLKWDKSSDIDGYEISYKKASSDKWITKYIESATVIKAIISKLKVNTKYNFRIRAYIYYGEDDEEYEEDTDDESYEDVEDATDEEEDTEEEEFDDYVYGDYSKLTLTTLNKNGKGVTTVVSSNSKVSAKVKATSFKKVQSTKTKQVDLKWVKIAKSSGYEIYISKKKSSGFKKIETINKTTTTTCTVNKLKSGKKYYFKIRSFIKSGSKNIYSKYSKVKDIKVK